MNQKLLLVLTNVREFF